MGLELLRLLVFCGGLALLLAVEGANAARPWRAPRGKRIAFHGALAFGNLVVLRILVAMPLLAVVEHVQRERWGLFPLFGLSGALDFLAVIPALLLFDLGDYFWHRGCHQLPFLWRFHKVHHADTHQDVTTSLRFHPGELVLAAAGRMALIVLLGPPIYAFVIFEIVALFATQFHHANIELSSATEAWLGKIVMTPRVHLAHHSSRSQSRNANFTTIFSFWDRVFGTRLEPTPENLAEQGLPYGRDRELDPRYMLEMPFKPEPEGQPAPTA